jgi:hypothetical protein
MNTKNRISCTALLACAACSSGDATTADHQDQIQVAGTIAANASLTAEPAAFDVLTNLATGIVPEGLSIDGAGRFTGDHGGLVIDGTITCLDLGTSTQVPCGPNTVNATVDGTWTATLELPRIKVAITRSGMWTLTGLDTPIVTINGSAHAVLASTFASASDKNHKQLTLTTDATYQSVTVDRASGTPTGGDIEYAITGQRDHTTPGTSTTATFSVDATLTFQPDHSATLVIAGGEDHSSFHVDLDTGDATCEASSQDCSR